MLLRHILCCLCATYVALQPLAAAGDSRRVAPAAPLGSLASPPSHGTHDTPEAAPHQKAPPHDATPEKREPSLIAPPTENLTEPDVASCVNGFLAARDWVTQMSVPETASPDAAYPLPGVRGVCILLRFDGRIIGSGEDWPGSVGDDRMLRRAVARAIASALGDDLLRNLDPVLRNQSGRRLAIEIEFAGRPEPLLGRTFDECALRVDRGLDGLALRRGYPGSISWHVAFPSRMLASNTARSPRAALERLARDSGLPDKDLPDLGRIEPVGVFRFGSLRLAQATPDDPPTVRGRGIARVSDGEVTRESVTAHAMGILRRFARTMALPTAEGVAESQAVPPGIGVLGNYIPVRDSFEPFIAPPQDQALVAWAAAAVATSPAFSAAERAEALALTERVLNDFIDATPSESQPLATVPAMAAFACAIELLTQDVRQATDGDLRRGVDLITDDLIEASRLAREKLNDRLSRGNNVNERALAAVAAAMSVGTERRFIPATELHKIVDSMWKLADRQQLIGILPWLVIADIAYARATGEPAVHVTEAQMVMKVLLMVQAGFSELASEQDLRGGFRLSGERRSGVTSQSLRPGLALAAMLAYAGFSPTTTAEEVATQVLFRARLISLLRFSQELTISGDLPAFYRNPSRVEGGVREALWDSEQHVAANAMAVLVDVFALQTDVWGPPPTLSAPLEAPTDPSVAPAAEGPASTQADPSE